MLPHPTLTIPGTNEYLIQLDIWHELHCLNDLRMLLYPERFPGLAAVTDTNGVIDRESINFRHWAKSNSIFSVLKSKPLSIEIARLSRVNFFPADHCVDSIRETLMCHADVSPIPFRINFPANQVIVPRLATTHTCRNFTKVQEWAKAHEAGAWNYNVTAKQAEEIMADSGFDNSPWEDIQDQYMAFPGNTYFKYWRDHPEEAEAARRKSVQA